MKKFIKLSSVSILLLLFFTWSCHMDNFDEIKTQQKQSSDLRITRITKDLSSARLDGEELCGDMVVNPMYGLFQHDNLGYVYMGNDEENLYVNFETSNGWKIYRTYLFVGDANDLPTGFWGLPRVGHFPYIDKHLGKNVNDHTMTIPLENIDGECTTVAAFAIIYKWKEFRGHKYLRYESVWAHGTNQLGRHWGWGWTNNYCIQDCGNNGGGGISCYEAWADAPNSYQISTDRLGWYDTYTTSLSTSQRTLYANSGSGDITSGTPIGTVSVFYYNRGNGSYDLSVTYYVSDDSYNLSEVHLYVGDTAPDMDPNSYTYVNDSPITNNLYSFTFRVTYPGNDPPPLVIAAEGVACTSN